MPAVVDKEHMRIAGAMRAALAEYEGARDLIEVGAYAHGSNAAIDEAIRLRPALEGFLCQELDEQSDMVRARAGMEKTGILQAKALLGAGAGLVAGRSNDVPAAQGQFVAAAAGAGAAAAGSGAAGGEQGATGVNALPPFLRGDGR